MKRREKFRGDGKIVVTLHYGDNDADVAIPVRLVQETKKVERSTAPYKGKGSKPRQTSGCMFRVYWEEIGLKPVKADGDVRDFIEAADIEVLRAVVMDRLDKEHEIEWEEWLLVTVSSGYGHNSEESNVEFGWETAYIAHLPDGRTVHRTSNFRSDCIVDGIPATGKTRRGDTTMVGLVKSTPENTAALEEMVRRLDELRDRMMDFLSPKKIEKTLATAASRLLPLQAGKGT
jgi:hypothetical protein